MKFQTYRLTGAILLLTAAINASAAGETTRRLFMDVHQLGSVTAEAVAEAHRKDLAVQDQYDVNFLRYWVDETNAKVYCLAEAADTRAISSAHAQAHGLVPQDVYQVTGGDEEAARGQAKLYMDVHKVGAGKVTAEDVAAAHEKDLATHREAHGLVSDEIAEVTKGE